MKHAFQTNRILFILYLLVIVPGCLVSERKHNGEIIRFKAPQIHGKYRLFVFVYNGNDNFVTANTPSRVVK
jgi:hypothetical protein